MEEDCEAYIDSEEDEVFFGSINERELQYFQKKKLDSTSPKAIKNTDTGKQVNYNVEKFKDGSEEISEPIDVPEESNFRSSCESSIEMDHNYSIHVQEKIDKSILETPRSIVKADKDGGFLKVLSEIALVKAEVENNEKLVECEADKENKDFVIPEIKITEATPDKKKDLSPCQHLERHLRRFRIIYNSPNMNTEEEKSSQKCDIQGKEEDVSNEKNFVKLVGNEKDSLSNSSNDSNTASVVLKENESAAEECKILKMNSESMEGKNQVNAVNNVIEHTDESFFTTKEKSGNCEIAADEKQCNTANVTLHCTEKDNHDFHKEEVENNKQICAPNHYITNLDTADTGFKSTEYSSAKVLKEISELRKSTNSSALPRPIRFSQDVRKIVEVLGKSADDTFNSTIAELDVKIEDSFFSSEAISFLNESNDLNETVVPPESKLISPESKNTNKKMDTQFNTVEKMNFKETSTLPGFEIESLKYFSEKKVQPANQNTVKKCIRKLPVSEKKLASNKLNMKENIHFQKTSTTDFTSRIPVFGGKIAKISCNQGKNQYVTAGTPLKFPSEKIYKNQKFKNVTSPVNAYIHGKTPNKPVANSVKQEPNKNVITKIYKTSNIGSVKKNKPFQELAYPFTDGQRAIPQNIERKLESSKLLHFGSAQKAIVSSTSKPFKANVFSRKA